MSGYQWLVAVHVIAMVAWMAGMFYLPRLFVYHADAAPGSDKSETFKVMERRLLRAIMNPAMIATWVAGIALAIWSEQYREPWLMVKFVLVLGMSALHGWLSARRKEFERDANTRPARTYRIVNEVPTLLLIGIVILAVVKPF
ncbi:MAG: protoporphyrinogen oxidase HemJ [Bauldia sp.]